MCTQNLFNISATCTLSKTEYEISVEIIKEIIDVAMLRFQVSTQIYWNFL